MPTRLEARVMDRLGLALAGPVLSRVRHGGSPYTPKYGRATGIRIAFSFRLLSQTVHLTTVVHLMLTDSMRRTQRKERGRHVMSTHERRAQAPVRDRANHNKPFAFVHSCVCRRLLGAYGTHTSVQASTRSRRSRMFTYTRVREGDGVPVVYTHESTLNEVLTRMEPKAREEAALIMLRVLIRERSAFRAEWFDEEREIRITMEQQGVPHAYNDVGLGVQVGA